MRGKIVSGVRTALTLSSAAGASHALLYATPPYRRGNPVRQKSYGLDAPFLNTPHRPLMRPVSSANRSDDDSPRAALATLDAPRDAPGRADGGVCDVPVLS